jgi:hypothetical protein
MGRAQAAYGMIARVLGTALRGVLVAALVLAPALLMPPPQADTAQILVLFALIAGGLTALEYGARHPGLVEFRHAPPYNRLRFVALAGVVLALPVVLLAPGWVAAPGRALAGLAEFPGSPLRLFLGLFAPADRPALAAAAGLGALWAAGMTAAFAAHARLGGWPAGRRLFNLWINLPSHDAAAGRDVARRLVRSARASAALAILWVPGWPLVLAMLDRLLAPLAAAEVHSQAWLLAAWIFVPASLAMRAVALGRVARLLRAARAAPAPAEGAPVA